VAQEQRVAAGGLPHQVGRQSFERSADDRFDQRNALLLVKRLQLEPLQIAVLPQRRHRIGNRFTGANCRKDSAGLVDGDLMQQRRGQVVEQVGIVDAHDGILLCDKGFARRSKECGWVT
jgi:hypothetical protein